MPDKQKTLLIVLASLLVIKFLIVPIFEWQNSVVSSNMANSIKLEKAKSAIENQQKFKEQVKVTRKTVSELKSLLVEYKEENQFHLEQQQWLEKIFEENNLEISNVGWSNTVPVPEWGAIQHEVSVNFRGNALSIQKVQMILESQKHWVSTAHFNFRFGKKRVGRVTPVTGSINLRIYMQEPV